MGQAERDIDTADGRPARSLTKTVSPAHGPLTAWPALAYPATMGAITAPSSLPRMPPSPAWTGLGEQGAHTGRLAHRWIRRGRSQVRRPRPSSAGPLGRVVSLQEAAAKKAVQGWSKASR
jgi:hypothetical protein